MRTIRALVSVVVIALLSVPSLSRSAEERNAASSGARKQVTEATTELTKAQAALIAKKTELRAEAEKTGDWAKALEAQKKAKEDLDAAGKPVIETLAAKSEYQKLLADKKSAELRKETLRLNGAAPDKLFDAATKVVTIQASIKKLEDEALAADPKVVEAKKRYLEATAAVAALQRKFEESVKDNADYKTAADAVATAQEKVKSARQTATDASRQDRETRRTASRDRDSNRDNGRERDRDSRRTERRNQQDQLPPPPPPQPQPEQQPAQPPAGQQ